MYLLPLIVLVLQTALCLAEDETQVLIKGTPKQGDWICTAAGINFTEFLQRTHAYVDKTLLLEKLFANENAVNVFLTLPPRWGKSLTLKLAEFFFGFEVAADNSVVPAKTTISHQFFTEGKIPAGGNYTESKFPKVPLISKRSEFVTKHLAQYHVVYLSFVDFGPAKNFPKFYNNFKAAVSKVFEDRLYIKNLFVKNITDQLSTTKDDTETQLLKGLLDNLKKQFDCYLNKEDGTEEQWADNLVYLSKLVNQYYEKKVIFLLDSIDYIAGMMSEMGKIGRNRTAAFLRNFLYKTLNEGVGVYKTIATATLPLVLDGIANNTAKQFVYLGNLANELNPLIGFTEGEFKELSEPLKIAANETEAAEKRYGGYFDVPILNPISVSHFLNALRVDNYWVRETSAHVNELNVLPDSSFHDALKRVMNGEVFQYALKRKLPIVFGYDSKAVEVSPIWIGEGASDPSVGPSNTDKDDDFVLYLLAKGIATLGKKGNTVRIANDENKAVVQRRFPEL